jgi:putative selenium metabolism hydrolase
MEKLGYDGVETDSMGNLIGTIGRGSQVIALDGHCDTVGPGDPSSWKVDPFEGRIEGGMIRGRGAADQKGGLAAAVYAGHLLKQTGIPSGLTLMVVASVLEEPYEGLCWDRILERGDRIPEAVILTEPTNLEVCHGHRGRMEFSLSIRGRTSHGATPQRGDNAVVRMAPVILEIDALNRRLPSSPSLGKGTITISEISSDAPSRNAVAEQATIILDRRVIPGETADDCRRQLEYLPAFRRAKARLTLTRYRARSYRGKEYTVNSDYPAWLMAADHPLVCRGLEVAEQVTGRKSKLRPWQFSTNGVSTCGRHGIPTIGFGPGDDRLAHTPGETVAVDDLLRATAFYTRLIQKWKMSAG